MSIHVKYFASLREAIGRSTDDVACSNTLTVEEVWNLATNQMQPPDRLLIAVNQEYANFNNQVCDGDEVAFFPPVTGG